MIPENDNALGEILTDGRGRLYVFPTPDEGSEVEPMDVYSPLGDLLLAGVWPPDVDRLAVRGTRWLTASGDYVYGIKCDPEGVDSRRGNTPFFVVRYRLALTPEKIGD